MDHGPESPTATDLRYWIACERDAEWTAKLAILSAVRCEDVRHFGECLREHNRHANELLALARMVDVHVRIPPEPTFVTADPFVVGAIDNGPALLDAMVRLEGARIERYLQRSPTVANQPASRVHGLLDRHLAEARARLGRLRELRESGRNKAA